MHGLLVDAHQQAVVDDAVLCEEFRVKEYNIIQSLLVILIYFDARLLAEEIQVLERDGVVAGRTVLKFGFSALG